MSSNPTIVVQPGSNVSSAAIQKIVKERQQMTEEYDPHKRTPIKVSGPEMCPHCGQPIPTMPKSMLTSMNNYINEAGLVITASDDRNIWEASNGVKWYKVTSPAHEVAASKYLEATLKAAELAAMPPTDIPAPVMVETPKSTLPKLPEVPTTILQPVPVTSPTTITGTSLPPVPSTSLAPVIELKTNLTGA